MQSVHPKRRPPWALIVFVALALGIGWGTAWLLQPSAIDGPESGASVAPGSASPAVEPVQPIATSEQRPNSARFEASVEPSEPNPIAGPAPLQLRFVRGTTGRPAPGIGVRLSRQIEVRTSIKDDLGDMLLAQGQTDAHGRFAAPASLRELAFAIDVDAGDGKPWMALPDFVMPQDLPTDGSALEVEVLGAWALIEARVLDDSGAPVGGASVQFDFESPALAFSTRDAPSTRATTNADGIASIELLDPASAGGRLRIKAEAPPDLRSDPIELPPPLKSARVDLHLATSARAIVRVESAAGAPLSGAMARLERLEPPFTRVGRSTGPDGTARFLPLDPGRYAASAEDPSTGSSARTEFTIARCQIADMKLSIPPSEQPLAVAGKVQDADGRPISWLSVSICVDGREEARLTPDGEGRFAYHRAPCESLRVRLKSPFDGPQVEPELIDARFGAQDLVFVLSDAPRMGFSALSVVDAETGTPLNGVRAAVFRDSAAERIGGAVSALAGSALSLASNDAGLLFVPSGPQMPRAHLLVEKRGYVRREIDLSEIAFLPQRDGRPTLELARGFVHRWIVRDARSGAPIRGAIATRGVDPFTGLPIEDGSAWGPSAPSDARGVLELALPQTPTRISIQAAGYRPRAVEAAQNGPMYGVTLLIEDTLSLEKNEP